MAADGDDEALPGKKYDADSDGNWQHDPKYESAPNRAKRGDGVSDDAAECDEDIRRNPVSISRFSRNL